MNTPIGWVFIGALALRIYSATMRCVINPDGAQYLFQASAIFNHQWSDLLACKLNYVAPLPFFIAAAFGLFKDWVVAGQVVNVIFGTATLIPLYYLLRRFADQTVCTLTLLIYALMPVFVEGSGNILRGPIFWFCCTLGMLMFIRQFDEDATSKRFRMDLILSCLCFSLATWARIEGIMFLLVSPAYLIFCSTPKKFERLVCFMAPVALCGMLATLTALATNHDLMAAMRLQKVVMEATQFTDNFETLGSQLKTVYDQDRSLYGKFLHRAHEVLIFIPLISIFHNILEGIFYPFAAIFLVGFAGLRRRYQEHRRIGYLLWLTLAGFGLLYIHMIQTWIISYRFLAVLIFPGCIIMASGIDTLIGKLAHLRQWPAARAACAAAIILILLGLPKSLKPEERDKTIYRQAAQIIAQHRTAGEIESIYAAQPRRAFEWVLLYAHRNERKLGCSKANIIDIPNSYRDFRRVLDKVNARYFFYERRNWPQNHFDLTADLYQNDLRVRGQWKHPDSGTAILFERVVTEY